MHRNPSFRFDGLQKEEQQLLLALYDPHQPEVLITHWLTLIDLLGFTRVSNRYAEVLNLGQCSGLRRADACNTTMKTPNYCILAQLSPHHLLCSVVHCTHVCIPDICQFWYAFVLFEPVKSTPKVRKFVTKENKISLNSALSLLKSTPAWKSILMYTLMISYHFLMLHTIVYDQVCGLGARRREGKAQGCDEDPLGK